MKRTFSNLLLALFALAVFPNGATIANAQTPPGELVDSSRLEKQPELKKLPKIKLRKRGATGKVVLRFIVNKEGKIENLILVSFSDPDFIDPVLEAYEKAAYSPGMLDGKPVATWIEVTVAFPQK